MYLEYLALDLTQKTLNKSPFHTYIPLPSDFFSRIYILNYIDSLKRENGNTSKVSDKVRSGLNIPDDNPNLPK